MDIGTVQKREIAEEMQESYLDYAMSVIIARALPDARDGLKPVQRRILYTMREMGLWHSAKFRKCAAIVGDTMGKFHPHGDASIYDALVRMAQPFSLRYPLIDGQGNFGSIDGDAAAAFRYTEARLTALAEELLADLEKETVTFTPNYDATRMEPAVLPTKLPQLMLNGSMGIAVGMATSIPPHNLAELVDAMTYLLEHPDASHGDIIEIVPGPDFPTGGIIFGKRDIAEAYGQGRGPILVRGKAEIIESERGRGGQTILITEIPYQVNKADLVTHIADLVQEKKVEGIRDIRDESDREGLRIVIELKQDSFPQKVLNRLYQFTDLQKSFHLNMLALVDGIQPQVLSLRSMLEQFVGHRKVVIRKRAEFDLARTRERLHILEGLHKALSHIDAIIRLIKASKTKEDARAALRKRFGFSDIQAHAILAMPLSALAGLERKKIEDELKEKKTLVKSLEYLLAHPKQIIAVMKEELAGLKKKYGDGRRTKIVASRPDEFSEEDLVPEEDVVIVLTRDGSIKRMDPAQFRVQQRGGKGVAGLALREEDTVAHFALGNTHDVLLFFTTKGRVFRVMAWEIPEAARQSRGKAIVNFLNLAPQEAISTILPMSKNAPDDKFLFLATRNGIVKKTGRDAFNAVRRSGLLALALKKEDELSWASFTSGRDDVLLATGSGKAIRFNERNVRSMGRTAAGVLGIRAGKDDKVVGMEILRDKEGEILAVTENGYGKRTKISQFRMQGRGGSGVKLAKVTKKTGPVISMRRIPHGAQELVAISRRGQMIRTNVASIPTLGRATQGVRIMKLEPGDKAASFIVL